MPGLREVRLDVAEFVQLVAAGVLEAVGLVGQQVGVEREIELARRVVVVRIRVQCARDRWNGLH